MKKSYLTFFVLLFIQPVFSQKIIEIIKPLNLPAGETKSFLISDIFYSEKYDSIDFKPDSSLQISYQPDSRLLEVTSLKNSEAYGLIPFIFYSEKYYIPYKSETQQIINFSFKPAGDIERVNLFGSFNGWNRENLPMNDEDGDGVYDAGVKLEPGRYEYQFYVEAKDGSGGEEILDTVNPDSIPNGLGGWNSVVTVKPLHTGKAYLHLINYDFKETNSLFSFYYESEKADDFKVIALLDNELVPRNVIGKQGDKIFIDISAEKLIGNKTLRVAVNENRRASNLQTIFLKDGKPLNKQDTTWHDAVIYSIMIDRFNDGDPTNSIPVEHPELLKQANYYGGDLQGIINKLEERYFNSLGINTLWLSPVIDNTPNAYQEYLEPYRFYSGYHGYWPVHHAKVEEKFGDMDLLKKLINTAHSKGIKVLLDYVANHIHIEHPFWKEHRDWFGNLYLPDSSKNLRMWDEYRLTTWFEPFMPKFDYVNSKEALDYMTDNAVWWLKETGADGFRHDAVKHVPNEFWRLLTRKIKSKLNNPARQFYYQIGETFGSYDLVSSYVNNGQLDAQFNFILYDTAIPTFVEQNSSFTALDQQMQKTFNVYGVNNLMGNVMDSHDKTRFMAYADGDISLSGGVDAEEVGWANPPDVDDPVSYKKLKLYLAFIMTIPGVPVVYYGDEIGMTGAGDPDNRRMMRFDDEITALEKETLDDVKEIISLRNDHSALRYGDFQALLVDENIYTYLRSDLNERIIVILNKGNIDEKINITLPENYDLQKAVDLISGDEYKINSNTLPVNVSSLAYHILKVE